MPKVPFIHCGPGYVRFVAGGRRESVYDENNDRAMSRGRACAIERSNGGVGRIVVVVVVVGLGHTQFRPKFFEIVRKQRGILSYYHECTF